MAWVSPKVFAILSSSEEGKDIIEQLPDMTQDECQAELDRFFGEGGKGASSSKEYGQAKFDDEAEEERYKAIGDEEVSEKDYEDDTEEEQEGEVTDEEISEALADFEWQITDRTTVDDYARETAEKLGIDKQRVLDVIMNEAPDEITPDMKMSKVAGLDDDEVIPTREGLMEKHKKITDGFEMPKEEGWEESDFGEKSFIKNKDTDHEMFIQYNGAGYDGVQDWVAGYMQNGEYVDKHFTNMEEAKDFLDNANFDQGENHRIWNEELAQRYADGDVSHEESIVIDYLNGDMKSEQFYKEYFKMNREKRKKADELFDKYYPGSPAEKEDNEGK